jgi:hypothetical protein
MNIVEKLIELFGFHHELFENPNLSWNDILTLMDKYGIYTQTIDSISKNPNITPEIVKSHPEMGWNKYVLYFTKKIEIRPPIETLNINNIARIEGIEVLSRYASWKVISTYRNDIKWCWKWVSANPSITMEIIRNNRDIPWDFEYISRNPNLTIDFVEENRDEKWNFNDLFKNPFNLGYCEFPLHTCLKKKVRMKRILNSISRHPREIVSCILDFV